MIKTCYAIECDNYDINKENRCSKEISEIKFEYIIEEYGKAILKCNQYTITWRIK